MLQTAQAGDVPSGSKAISCDFYIVSQEVLGVFVMSSSGIRVVHLALRLIELWLNEVQVVRDCTIAKDSNYSILGVFTYFWKMSIIL